MRPLSCKTLENERLFQNRERKRPASFRTASVSHRPAILSKEAVHTKLNNKNA
jgi:hypothetical protein